MSTKVPDGPTSEVDTGDFLAVPEGERLETDNDLDSEMCEDAFVDYAPIVSDGVYVELSTASLDDTEPGEIPDELEDEGQ